MDGEETMAGASEGFNGASALRNDREGAFATTPRSRTVAGRKNRSRLTRLRRGTRQRAVTAGEERLARPVRREMKPEASDASADAAGDFEQLESDGADGRRCESRPDEDVASKVREERQGETMQLQAERVRAYIANQEKHHRKRTFKEEFVALLKAHDVEFDEKWLWQ